MKKLLKIVLFPALIGFGIMGYATLSIVGTALKGTDIGITDLFKAHLSPEKAAKLESNMIDNSSKLGTDFAKKVEGVMSIFIPDANVDYSKVPAPPYPYESPTPQIESASNKGFQEGLDILEQSDKENEAVKSDSLNSNK